MLTEPQIQRYARQILLKGVGGKGQERLLATPVEVRGQSEALSVAANYLVLGGSPVAGSPPGAFLGALTPATVNPDAASAATPVLEVVAAPETPSGRLPWVWLGPGVVMASPLACALCVQASSAAGGLGGPEVSVVARGSAAALLAQRVALGTLTGPTAFRFDLQGLSLWQPPACAAHQGGPLPLSWSFSLAEVLMQARAHAEASAPNEAVAVVLKRGETWAYHVLPNRRAGPQFEVAPSDWVAMAQETEQAGAVVVALAHSHPTGPAIPSLHDAEGLAPGGAPHAPLFLLTSVEPPQQRWWRFVDGRFLEEKQAVVDF